MNASAPLVLSLFIHNARGRWMHCRCHFGYDYDKLAFAGITRMTIIDFQRKMHQKQKSFNKRTVA